MKKNTFTPEQIQQLRDNPYTDFVSASTIRYTSEFKELFWQKYQKGKLPRQIFSEYGFDPQILGDHRISNTAYKISQSHSPSAQQKETDRIKELETQVRSLQFQLETLKKILSAANSRKSKR